MPPCRLKKRSREGEKLSPHPGTALPVTTYAIAAIATSLPARPVWINDDCVACVGWDDILRPRRCRCRPRRRRPSSYSASSRGRSSRLRISPPAADATVVVGHPHLARAPPAPNLTPIGTTRVVGACVAVHVPPVGSVDAGGR
jgi:hypothetical protein